jgi:tetratricopeptide (TPR) repeat protein
MAIMPIQAFVASTYEDLKDHRTYVVAALRSAGIFVDPMEDWTAAIDEPKVFSQKRLEGCDLCVLLVGFRRGHVPENETSSITQLEYQAAAAAGVDTLVYLLSEQAEWPPEFNELDKDPEIQRWRAALKEQKGVGFFDREPSTIQIAPALTRWVAERRSVGLERNREWLGALIERAEREFARQMSGGESADLSLASRRYIELLVKDRRGPEAVPRPFAELSETRRATLVIFGAGGSGKSTALLKLAVDAGRRALDDPEAPLPLFARLNFFDASQRGFERLMEIIGGAAGIEPASVKELWRGSKRPLLFLLDGFNEIGGEFQSSFLLALQELIQVNRHGYRITSRTEVLLERFASDRSDVQAGEVVELDEAQVSEFLSRLEAGALFDRMGAELKKLGRNPFMLWALARSCAEMPQGDLPRNKGQLYLNFIERYIFGMREARKLPPPTTYSYPLVKKPILGRLALEMTRDGLVKRQEDLPFLKRIRDQLREIRGEYDQLLEVRAHDLMPDPPVAKGLLDEVVRNGVLQRVGDSLEFMHQSIQDCFAAMALVEEPISSTLALVNEAAWVRSAENAMANEQRTTLFDALVMRAGLLPTSGELVAGLLEKDPILAGECFAAAPDADPRNRELLLDKSQVLLRSGDATSRYVGCSCVAASQLASPEVVDSLEQILLSEKEWLGCRIQALTATHHLDSERVVRLLLRLLASTSEVPLRLGAVMDITRRSSGTADVRLAMGIGTLQGDRDLSLRGHLERDDSMREDLMKTVWSLHGAGPTLDDLVRGALVREGWEPPFLLLKLVYRDEAVARLKEIIRNSEKSHDAAIVRLPFMHADAPVAQTLLDTIDDPAGTPTDRALAAIGSACLILPERVVSTKGVQAPPASFLKSELVKRVMDRHVPFEVRAVAALAIIKAGEDADLQSVLERMSDASDDPEFRKSACAMCRLGDLPRPPWMSLFILPPLGRDERLVDFLVGRALEDERRDVRIAAVEGLHENTPQRATTQLVDRLKAVGSALNTRLAAAEALGILGSPSGRPALLELLADEAENVDVRMTAMVALSKFTDEETASVLEGMVLRSGTLWTRRLAGMALCRRRIPEGFDRISALFLDSERDRDERLHALDALEHLSSLEHSALTALLDAAVRVRDESLSVRAVEGAYQVQPDRTIATMHAVLTDPSRDEGTREAAAIGLAILDSTQAETILAEISSQGSDSFAAGSADFALELGKTYKANNALPDERRRLIQRAMSHLKAQSWGRAVSDFDRLFDLGLGNHDFRIARSTGLRMMGRLDEALADAIASVELSGEDAMAHSNLGDVYAELDRKEDAMRAFRRAIELAPEYVEAHSRLANVASAAGLATEAFASALEAARLAPEDGDCQFTLGWYAYEAGALAQSIDASRRAIELLPDEPMASFNLGLALLAADNSQAALPAYRSGIEVCLRLAPQDARQSIQGALGDLATLSQSRPELDRIASDIDKTLRSELGEIEASDPEHRDVN